MSTAVEADKWPAHPAADLFPMMTDEELSDLAADIKANGLIHPIVVDKAGVLIDGRNRPKACEIAGIEPAVAVFEGDDTREYIFIARRHMSKGQQAMAVAMAYPESEKTTHGKKSKTKLLLETKANLPGARLSQARTVLAYSTDLARTVLTGSRALDAPYDEAKKVKQPLNAKVAAKTRRAANTRRRMPMSEPQSATPILWASSSRSTSTSTSEFCLVSTGRYFLCWPIVLPL
jgi:hypothetical protein